MPGEEQQQHRQTRMIDVSAPATSSSSSSPEAALLPVSLLIRQRGFTASEFGIVAASRPFLGLSAYLFISRRCFFSEQHGVSTRTLLGE